MVEPFLNTLLGCAMGSIAGLIPGTGLLVSLMIVYPYLLGLDLVNLLCFYIGLANLAQFTGSVTAIHFGIPGESNSIPAVIEGHALAKKGHGHRAIIGTSLSSVTAGILTLLLLIALTPFFENIFNFFYKTVNQLVVFATTLLIFLFASKNKWYLTMCLMFVGYLLGKIGFNEYTGQHFLTFNNADLSTGLPIFPVLVGLLVMPQLSQTYQFSKIQKYKLFGTSDILLFFKNIKYSLLGTGVGFVCGLVPGVSTVLATNLSHKISKFFDQSSMPSYKSLISVEASNNSAIIVTLLPLIILGIPITGSEAMLLSIMERNIIDINWQIILANNFQYIIATSIFLSLLLGLLVSWPLSTLLSNILYLVKRHFKWFTTGLILIALLYTASITDQHIYFMLVFLIFYTAGVLLKKIDVLPLIFVFLLQNKLESVAIISYNLLW